MNHTINKIRLLNQFTWKCVAEYDHTSTLRGTGDCHVFKEVGTIRGGSVGGVAGDDREETKRNTRGERGRPSGGRGRSQRASIEKENVGSVRTGDMSSDLEGVSVRAMDEEDGKEADDAAAFAEGAPPPAYEITECGEAVVVPTVNLDPLKENPRLGVGMVTWSSCSKYIVSSTK